MKFCKFRCLCAFLWLCMTGTPAVAWDPVRDLTGRTIKQHVERKIDKAGVAAKKLLHNPVDYLIHLPESLIADVCSAPVQYYENSLRGQARNSWRSLPPIFVESMQGAYSVDLSSVRYAVGIRTADGTAQTFGRWIYFPREIDLRNHSDLHWMLHELEHVVQYSGAKYGYAGSLCEYTAKSVGSGFQHDRIDWERAADAKANWTVDYAYLVMNQGIPQGLSRHDSLARNQILIFNDTDYEVVFFMETAFTEEGQERIPPRAWTVFTGDRRDTWFNVRIGTETRQGAQWISYGLNGATRQHIEPNQYGVLDFYYE